MSDSIEHDFWAFHRANPHVYQRLRTLAVQLKERGHSKLGIGMLFEVVRWQTMMRTSDPSSEFKLNNNYRALYARLLMESESELAGIFETRQLHRDTSLAVAAPDVAELEAPVADLRAYEERGGRLI